MVVMDVNDSLSASGGQYFFHAKKVLDEKDTWGERVEDFVFVFACIVVPILIKK